MKSVLDMQVQQQLQERENIKQDQKNALQKAQDDSARFAAEEKAKRQA